MRGYAPAKGEGAQERNMESETWRPAFGNGGGNCQGAGVKAARPGRGDFWPAVPEAGLLLWTVAYLGVESLTFSL